MGNTDSRQNFRKAFENLLTKNNIDPEDEEFWCRFWQEPSSLEQIFSIATTQEIRQLRTSNPTNLSTLCYKIVERLAVAVDLSCRTQVEQTAALSCVHILIRILPYVFEDDEWIDFFWSSIPSAKKGKSYCLAESLINTVCDLLFCPDFTVASGRSGGPDKAEELSTIDSCEYIWEAGVGFANSPPKNSYMEYRRKELLQLLLTCFSESMFRNQKKHNKWIAYFTSAENRHALPLFTSLLNTVCAYDPIGIGIPYNHLLASESTEPLVETCLQILIVTLDHDIVVDEKEKNSSKDDAYNENLFINYLSRVHRDEDFQFILGGIARLLNNPLVQNYLPNSIKRVHCHQELLVLFWKICDYNKKFLYFTLKSSDVLEILIPVLYHLNNSRADQSRVGLMHIGVFILLLLSGERNFGVRLNKPYIAAVPMDIPVFTGTHADLLITVFHKIIATGHQRLQPLFDCLLTILVNVSPYLKTLSMVASVKLLHLLEAFSTPWFLLSSPNNHHLVFFLLEMFNNIIQYQFDGNSNLVYTIIRKRHVFHAMANLPSDMSGIAKCLKAKKMEKFKIASIPKISVGEDEESTDGISDEAQVEGEDSDVDKDEMLASAGTLKATLKETPKLNQMTEKESTDPSANTQDVEDTIEHSTISTTVQKTSLPKSRSVLNMETWTPTNEWVQSWRSKLPLQTIMRLLQVLVPQVEKICIDKGLTDETEILKFLQHGTLVGLLPVPHPILIRKYQPNSETTDWFRTYVWGVIYLRNTAPSIWYDTSVKLFEIQKGTCCNSGKPSTYQQFYFRSL